MSNKLEILESYKAQLLHDSFLVNYPYHENHKILPQTAQNRSREYNKAPKKYD